LLNLYCSLITIITSTTNRTKTTKYKNKNWRSQALFAFKLKKNLTLNITVESQKKSMIVISHSWEFVPKGSSHFAYNINGAKSAKKVTNLHNTFNLNNNLNLNAFQRHLNNNNINNNNCTYTDETRSINESITFALEQTFAQHEQTVGSKLVPIILYFLSFSLSLSTIINYDDNF
jgi:hypothetical protein